MFIVSKSGCEVYNTQYMEEMFVGQKKDQNKYMVGARLANGPGTTKMLGIYETREMAFVALKLLMTQMFNDKNIAFYMPTDAEVANILAKK